MARQTLIGLVLISSGLFLVASISGPALQAQTQEKNQEEREEIIIRGEDRQPTKSSFEYGNGGDTAPDRMETSEAPAARSGGGVESPELDKEVRTESSAQDQPRGTRLKKESSGYFWITVFGVLVLVAAAAG